MKRYYSKSKIYPGPNATVARHQNIKMIVPLAELVILTGSIWSINESTRLVFKNDILKIH